jgi:hypothetical protein
MKHSQAGDNEGMFEIDEIDAESRSPSKRVADSPQASDDDRPTTSKVGVNEDIELSRRALPVVEVEEDVCSICLDEFTNEDPEQQTVCE